MKDLNTCSITLDLRSSSQDGWVIEYCRNSFHLDSIIRKGRIDHVNYVLHVEIFHTRLQWISLYILLTQKKQTTLAYTPNNLFISALNERVWRNFPSLPALWLKVTWHSGSQTILWSAVASCGTKGRKGLSLYLPKSNSSTLYLQRWLLCRVQLLRQDGSVSQ